MSFKVYKVTRAVSCELCPTLCDPMDCSPPGSSVHGDSPGKNTGVGSRALLQGIFPTQRSNLCLLLWQGNSLPLNHLGSPYMHIHTNKYVCVGIYTELAMLGISNCLKKKKTETNGH